MRGRNAGTAFVGRSGDLEVLLDAYARAVRGQGAVVLVGGEAGVGKTRLVGEAAAHARRQGARVLVGQCLDLDARGPVPVPVSVAATPARRGRGRDRPRPAGGSVTTSWPAQAG